MPKNNILRFEIQWHQRKVNSQTYSYPKITAATITTLSYLNTELPEDPRDITPEATEDIIDRRVPGIPEAMRAYSMTITKRAMLSRSTAGIRKKTLIINLPGSPKAVKESLEYIIDALGHGIEIMTGEAGNCAR